MPKSKDIKDRAESTKGNYIKKFDSRAEEILRRKLAGERNQDIAKAMKLSTNRVSFIITSPIFEERMAKKQEIINKRFEEELATDPIKRKFQKASHEASDVLIDIMDKAPLGALKRNAANDVLEYGGQTKKPSEDHSTKIFIDKSTGHDIHVAIRAMNKGLKMDEDILKDLGLEGVVIDVEPTSGDKPESPSGNGEKKLLDILPSNNAKQVANGKST